MISNQENHHLSIYRASAGSGKTYTLVREYIETLFSSQRERPHRRTLAVTFTNKATEEMKSRIVDELFMLSTGQKSDYREGLMEKFQLNADVINKRAREILLSILHDYSGFSISTIDKFFQQIVRSFAREVGVSGGYNIELNNDNILQQAVDNLYSSLSEGENRELLAWLESFMKEKIRENKSWNVKAEILKEGEHIFVEKFQHKAAENREKLRNKKFLKEYRTKLIQIRNEYEKRMSGLAQAILDRLENDGFERSHFFRGFMHSNLEKLINNDLSVSDTFISFAKSSEKCYTKAQRANIKADIDHAHSTWLQEELEKINNLLSNEEFIHYNTAILILKNLNTFGILADLSAEVRKITDEQNLMLLSDTNLLLHRIIDNSDTPFVYERTGMQIDHFMIDEFQDTSVLQWQNFRPLLGNSLSEGKSNLVVGDVKQSIYRWRNSDWKLLGDEIGKEDFNHYAQFKSLLTNWRSDKEIISFNNRFFKAAAEKMQNELNAHESMHGKITTAYDDVEQKAAPNSGTGYVRVEFVERTGSKNEWQQEAMERIPPLLNDITARGYKPEDIAFLVRYNSEAALLTEFLLDYKKRPEANPALSYELVGREGLRLTISRSISFIIAALRLSLNPADDISRMLIQREYLTGKKKMSEGEAILLATAKNEEKQDVTSDLFSEAENESLENISRLPLFDACENLIKTFDLEKWGDEKESVFLQAFQDVIFKFSNSYSADLNSFLQWWEQFSDKQRINVPENESAFKVLTVHTAKGLDFKVVIVPFANWKMNADGKRAARLWCETDIMPFGELPLLPVQAVKGLENTIFKKEYIEELMLQYVDNLNVAYVAFTRARNEMHILAERPNKTKKSTSKTITISRLLLDILEKDEEFGKQITTENDIYESGDAANYIYEEEKSSIESRLMADYPTSDSSSRLKIRRLAEGFWEEQAIEDNKINYGLLMHEIMQQTLRRGDEERAIVQLLNEGKINENDAEYIRAEMQKFWEHPEVAAWFEGDDIEILNETAILLPNGQQYRPDRVVIRGKSATVIDYKFGEEKHSSYIRQLERYISILSDMGYDVSGRLFYVTLGEVVDM